MAAKWRRKFLANGARRCVKILTSNFLLPIITSKLLKLGSYSWPLKSMRYERQEPIGWLNTSSSSDVIQSNRTRSLSSWLESKLVSFGSYTSKVI